VVRDLVTDGVDGGLVVLGLSERGSHLIGSLDLVDVESRFVIELN
jgi:hypothetical protein